jgi:hypothetical protein
MDPVIIDKIKFDPPPGKLLKKLRVKKGSGQESLALSLLEEARQIASPKALYRLVGVDQHLENGVVLEGSLMESKVMAVNLSQVHRAFPYLNTSGRELYEWSQSKEDMIERFYAEEISHLALLAAEKHLLDHLKSNYQLARTSSLNPGSLDDWPITAQSSLFELLGDPQQAIGVELTESMLMIPNQSVSGIRYASETDFSNCELCPREKCTHRRAPFNEKMLKEKYQ